MTEVRKFSRKIDLMLTRIEFDGDSKDLVKRSNVNEIENKIRYL